MSNIEPVTALIAALAALDVERPDAERVDLLTTLERLKSAAAAVQARLTDAFATSHRATLVKAGSDTRDARRSVCAQIGLARRDSPHKGNRHVGLAATLVHELPGVLRALERGTPANGGPPSLPGKPPTSPRSNAPRSTPPSPTSCTAGAMLAPNAKPGPGRNAWTPTVRRTGPARLRLIGGCRSVPRRTA